MEKRLVLNRFITPDGTVLVSKYTHDYVSHEDANGELYFTDGGNEYIRKSENNVPMVDACLYSDSPFKELREHITRGTFDKDGKRIWIPISKMSNKHLENCVLYNKLVDSINKRMSYTTYTYLKELAYRYENGIFVDNYEYTSDMVCKCNRIEFDIEDEIARGKLALLDDDALMNSLYDELEKIKESNEAYSASTSNMMTINEIVERYERK